MITERNMIFANPQAYQVFPNMVNPYNTGTTELARYTGYLIITDNNGNTRSFTNTSAIDFTTISGLVTIDNVTDRGSVQLGRWRIPQSIIITNDITVTVTPIDEVSSDGATITPQYVVKYNTYSNGELSESIVVTPDNITLQSNVQWITVNNDQIVVSANTNTEARQGQVTIRVQYQEYSTTANYNIVQAGYDIGQDIMQSMVLWYDIAKQGATNESMATTPTLIDHSGNGHDATCYNFAWAGNSGIGGVAEDYLSEYYDSFLDGRRGRGTVTHNTVHITEVLSNSVNIRFFETRNSSQIIKSYKIKVSGIEQGKSLLYSAAKINGYSYTTFVTIEQDGEYELPEVDITMYKTVGFNTVGWYGTCDITIEQLPLYPNALVSDGVDDHAIISNLPVLHDWTVFIKKDIVEYPTISGWLLVDGGNSNECTLQYRYEYNEFFINSFGISTTVTDYVEKLDVFTPTSFNGNYVQKGDWQAKRTQLYLFGGGSLPQISMALHSVIVFNRTLTTEEIEWVKTNLITE